MSSMGVLKRPAGTLKRPASGPRAKVGRRSAADVYCGVDYDATVIEDLISDSIATCTPNVGSFDHLENQHRQVLKFTIETVSALTEEDLAALQECILQIQRQTAPKTELKNYQVSCISPASISASSSQNGHVAAASAKCWEYTISLDLDSHECNSALQDKLLHLFTRCSMHKKCKPDMPVL